MSKNGRFIFNLFSIWLALFVCESIAVVVLNNLDIVKESTSALSSFSFTPETLMAWANAYSIVRGEIGSIGDVIFVIGILLIVMAAFLAIRSIRTIQQEKFLAGENVVLSAILFCVIILSGILTMLFSTPFMLMIFAALLVSIGIYCGCK